MLSLYVHIPFCHSKCPYCDFNSAALENIPEEEYALSLMSELSMLSSKLGLEGKDIGSVYFGGGTPSILRSSAIKRIMYSIASTFNVIKDAEITIEANPEDLVDEKIEAWLESGFNRLSVGVQSLDVDLLKSLGRRHTPQDSIEGITLAKNLGFTNLNVDIICGVEGEDLTRFMDDIKGALELEPEHISLYALTVEKGTDYYERSLRGLLSLPEDESVLEMLKCGRETILNSGYVHYEISNYALHGRECAHNLSYWQGGDYIGIGAGAHSAVTFLDGESLPIRKRWANIEDITSYIRLAKKGREPSAWGEELSGERLGFEYLFLGLRTISGVSLAEYKSLAGIDLEDKYPGVLDVLVSSGFIAKDGDRIYLTEKGLWVADGVIENFAI
ncbi:MAG: radical SAM family heme chaperone HemW [Candidatus Dadabacteria bacterium]|nr:MAG: radical SAM family heme chaperone HemW [Candidatus Dadabacteria bacterium]